jgi:hypothetical protein
MGSTLAIGLKETFDSYFFTAVEWNGIPREFHGFEIAEFDSCNRYLIDFL